MNYLIQIQQSFSRQSKIFWFWLSIGVLSLLLLFTLVNQTQFWFTEANATVAKLSSTGSQSTAKILPTLQQILLWNLFDRAQNDKALAIKSVNLTINGIFLASVPAQSAVAMTFKGEQEKTYGVGDNIPGMGIIKAIKQDRVILQQDGELKALLLTMDRKGVKVTAPSKATTTEQLELYHERFKGLSGGYPNLKLNKKFPSSVRSNN